MAYQGVGAFGHLKKASQSLIRAGFLYTVAMIAETSKFIVWALDTGRMLSHDNPAAGIGFIATVAALFVVAPGLIAWMLFRMLVLRIKGFSGIAEPAQKKLEEDEFVYGVPPFARLLAVVLALSLALAIKVIMDEGAKPSDGIVLILGCCILLSLCTALFPKKTMDIMRAMDNRRRRW